MVLVHPGKRHIRLGLPEAAAAAGGAGGDVPTGIAMAFAWLLLFAFLGGRYPSCGAISSVDMMNLRKFGFSTRSTTLAEDPAL